jgi:hypothetical protein
MLGFALSLLCLRLVSVVLGGGYGIFCLIMSFYVPSVGADAFSGDSMPVVPPPGTPGGNPAIKPK